MSVKQAKLNGGMSYQQRMQMIKNGGKTPKKVDTARAKIKEIITTEKKTAEAQRAAAIANPQPVAPKKFNGSEWQKALVENNKAALDKMLNTHDVRNAGDLEALRSSVFSTGSAEQRRKFMQMERGFAHRAAIEEVSQRAAFNAGTVDAGFNRVAKSAADSAAAFEAHFAAEKAAAEAAKIELPQAAEAVKKGLGKWGKIGIAVGAAAVIGAAAFCIVKAVKNHKQKQAAAEETATQQQQAAQQNDNQGQTVPADTVQVNPAPTYDSLHVVQKNDNMWKINKGRLKKAGEKTTNARTADLTNETIRLNPQVENPNLIYPGDTLVMPRLDFNS